MRADQLKVALLEIKDIFAAAGVAAAEKDMAELAQFIERQGDRDVDSILAEIRDKLDPSARIKLLVVHHVDQLKASGLDEPKFRSAFMRLRDEKLLDKQAVLDVLKQYGVIRVSGKSRDSYLESLDKHFYWLLYNRDADAMAKRATPW
jgi:hypothetical protein